MPSASQFHPGSDRSLGIDSIGLAGQATRENAVTPDASLPSVSSEPRLIAVVNHVMDAVDRAANAPHSSVDLRFGFGEQDHLNVRVEWRDGTVYTTFRSSTPDLRDTVSAAWRDTVSAGAENRSYRIAEPVITSDSPSSGFATDAGGEQRQRQAGDPATPVAPRLSTAGTGRPPADSSASSRAASAFQPETSQHLHAFA